MVFYIYIFITIKGKGGVIYFFMKTLQKINLIRALKLGVGACLAILLAWLIQLEYPTTAGILAILTIQTTNRATLRLAAERLISFFVSLALALPIFLLSGYTLISFGIFLLVYSLYCSFFNRMHSLAPCAVLISHFLLFQSISIPILFNEFLLLFIGSGVGILANLFFHPKKESIHKQQQQIDASFRTLFLQFYSYIKNDTTKETISQNISSILQVLNSSITNAENLKDNTFFADLSYFPEFLYMRKRQINILKQSLLYLKPYSNSHYQKPLCSFLLLFSKTFHECNDGSLLLKDCLALQHNFQNQPLPTNQDSFEEGAIYFHFMRDLERIILLKKDFVESLPPEQYTQFLSYCQLPPL